MLFIDMIYVQNHDPNFAFGVMIREAAAKKREREMAAANV